ncbi:hypothetical protein [Kitasatospora sp. HPMI-4]|uniref:hypothetical protein n=1 Tax=Kitasatospora sp. HPMI-4 TaxID=3448443 RepID=UPI003F1A6568
MTAPRSRPRRHSLPAPRQAQAEKAHRKDTFALFDIHESVPTSATAAQLAAAAARRTTGTRTCEQCGVRPETSYSQVDGWLRCRICARPATRTPAVPALPGRDGRSYPLPTSRKARDD